ncbi:MAG: ATP-binding cassette domain-containing protein [Bacteriovoracaceae bacterium]|nr:ATP-binding cassette domain-containing protein [Bacteriovoracaceae bacterium]
MEEILRVKNLKKTFGEKTIHHAINFTLHKSETIGLLGNSGTGKSVLLRCLIGLETMDDGEVWLGKERIDLLKEEAMFKIRTRISYAFQSGALFDSLNVYENIAYPLREHLKLTHKEEEARVSEMLKLVRIGESGELFPSDLSGGMQKRAGLARAMVLYPEIILYDEPTAGLDPVNVENVLEIMRAFKAKGTAGIFVTHDIIAAKKVCDRLLIVDSGRIVFEGTVKQFEESTNDIVKNFQSTH